MPQYLEQKQLRLPILLENLIQQSAIKKRIRIKPKIKLILHTDRGTQFSNLKYNEFLEKNNDYVVASMSRANSPKDNTLIERFIRTFKEHKI